jgi:transmembrane sensor
MTTPDDQALEAASHWVAVLKRGEPGVRDRRALKAWLARDAANAAALNLMLDVWDTLEPLRRQADGMVRTEATAKRCTHSKRPILAKRSILAWMPVGGLALAGLAAALLLAPSFVQTYTTGLGEMKSVALADHSTVWLNTDSRLSVALSPFGRRLRLERGEGEFKVAHEAWRPFVVSTANASVRATGTDFSVRAEADGSRIVLVQGRVKVSRSDDGETADLHAGTVLVAPLRGAFRLSKADSDTDLAWRRGELIFYERPMGEVVQEFARYTGVKVGFADDAARRMRISGAFRATDFKAFLRDIATLYHVHASTDKNAEVVIGSRNSAVPHQL